MRVRPLPKTWLIHAITYEEHLGLDDWGNPSFSEPVTVNHVRFDDSTVFSRDNTQTRILANAVIFVDAINSSPVPEFKEQSKVTFSEKEYIVQKVVPCYHPRKNEIRHYELEVV